MRKHQQRQIVELLKTIEEAQAAGLYADCQQGALTVGGFIESIEGEGTKTVALLEDYCELVFKASNGEIASKALGEHLQKIENSVKTELKPNKIEMAFLSYKASMSDSIESIYLAAKEDPACDAYWIPIPYYDKNPDGSFGEMHIEGPECYGSNIECTDWQLYDIEARRPDAIFTFNPYDHENYVSSVHPDYYCERLRELTECLVYVPYFVAPGDELLDLFCVTYGCKYAHKVILQSEKVRDFYIKIFTEDFGDYFGDPKEKFIALGSPKLDKTLNSKREDFELPEKWAKLIGAQPAQRHCGQDPQSPEAKSKKVILYNTSVNAMIAGHEQYIKKIHHVLKIFKNRNDVILWWRPHPLMKTAFTSMRKELLDEYEQIVSEYISEGWGIYDDTSDLHRAIAWSDAYYGDGSSLTELYEAAGKPVMVQNIDMFSSEQARTLMFETMYYDGESCWLTESRYNALFKLDTKTWKAEFMGSFPNEQFTEICLYGKCAELNGKLYFAPRFANNIGVYDKKSKEFSTIKIKEPDYKIESRWHKSKFAMAVAYGSDVFFIGHCYPAIIKYDTETGNTEYITAWVKAADAISEFDEYGKYFSRAHVSGEVMIMPLLNANAVMAFNMKTHNFIIYTIGDSGSKYNNICFDGVDYWLTPKHNESIVKWNIETDENKEYDLSSGKPAGTERILAAYSDVIFYDKYLWLFPTGADKAIKVNPANGKTVIAEQFHDVCLHEAVYSKANYKFAGVVDNELYAFAGKTGELISYNARTEERREEPLLFPGEAEKVLTSELMRLFDSIVAEQKVGLLNFLDYIDTDGCAEQSERKRKIQAVCEAGSVSAKIYSYVKKEVTHEHFD